MPQVHGASRNAWLHLKELTEIELNSVTDNPIILDGKNTISGGNFHGQPLALPLDYACFAAAEIGNISDRRCYLLLEGKWGLPMLLMNNVGLNSGFMIPQYTTAALGFGKQDPLFSRQCRQHSNFTWTGRPCEHGKYQREKTESGIG